MCDVPAPGQSGHVKLSNASCFSTDSVLLAPPFLLLRLLLLPLQQDPKNKLDLHEGKEGVVYVKELTSFAVKSAAECAAILEVGVKSCHANKALLAHKSAQRSHPDTPTLPRGLPRGHRCAMPCRLAKRTAQSGRP